MKTGKLRGIIVLFALITVMGHFMMSDVNVYASSAMIELAVNESEIAVGNSFNVIMTVSATDDIKSVDMYVTYDAATMTYVSGGKYVSGSDGLLHIQAPDLGGDKNKVKFSLQFNAIAKGDSAIGLSDSAKVTDSSGTGMSTSSNRVSVSIKGEASGDSVAATAIPTATPEASGENRLESLLVSSGNLEPAFAPRVKKYSLTVDNNTDALYFSYKTKDKDAVVQFSGNENLIMGNNKVKVIVTAPNGKKRTYTIKVKKETAEETKARLLTEGGSNLGIEMSVREENGEVYINNDYEYKIVNVEDDVKIPAGYVKTTVRLYGINITAYTMANDLDNEFLLLYCLNGNGDKGFYQYDRIEKSIQRYTGDLIDRVNSSDIPQSAESMTQEQYETNLGRLAIIVAILAAICVLMISCLISMAIKLLKSKSSRTEDELDF